MVAHGMTLPSSSTNSTPAPSEVAAQEPSASIPAHEPAGRPGSAPQAVSPQYPKKATRTISTTEQQIAVLTEAVRTRDERIRNISAQKEEASQKVADLEDAIVTLRQDLAESRGFVSDDSTGDVSEVIRGIQHINGLIDDFVFQCSESLASSGDLDVPLPPQLWSALKAATGSFPKEAYKLARKYEKEGVPLEQFVSDMFASMLLRGLYHEVFGSFKIMQKEHALDMSIAELRDADEAGMRTLGRSVEYLYERVIALVPQARASRWRSITYASLPLTEKQSQSFAKSFSSRYIQRFDECLRVLRPTTSSTLVRFTPELTKRTLEAIEWRHKVQTKFLAYDYEVYWRNAEEEGAVAVKALGLLQARSVQSGGKVEREVKVLERSQVLTA